MNTFTFIGSILILLFAGNIGYADVKPAALFSDHAVLQAEMRVPVSGMAEPGERVTVTLEQQKQTVTAGADGKWMARLNILKAGGPYTLTI